MKFKAPPLIVLATSLVAGCTTCGDQGLDGGPPDVHDAAEVRTDAGPSDAKPCDAHLPDIAFVPVQHGTFIMGSPTNEPQRGKFSETQVQVSLTHDVIMAATEITQGQWDALCFDDPSGRLPIGSYNDGIGPDYPVGDVTYWDALSYANALSTLSGLKPCYVLSGCSGIVGHGLKCSQNDTQTSFYECSGFRLPTDAEFEYANRAGTTTATYAGDVADLPDAGVLCYSDPSIDQIGWCCASNVLTSQRVGQKPPNPWGLYDMVGNAIEWVDGTFDGLGYGPGPLTDPFGTVGATVDDSGVDPGGILRGGSFTDLNRLCRSAARLQEARTQMSGPGWGFRLVRTAAPGGG